MINIKKAIGISFAGQYLEVFIHFLAVLVLARILTPTDIGTYSVAAFLMAVLHVFRDFGVAQYVIQERELTTEKIRSAMGVAIILALSVALILLLSSGIVARFYGKPEIQKILWVMAASFAISPFGAINNALFRREMQLKKIFVMRIGSTLCHVAVAISLAMYGFGALSLAGANFAGILSIGIIASLLRPSGMPWLPHFKNIKKVLSFGSVASLGNAANTAGTNAPDLIVGKIMDMTSVGYLSRANGLVQLFTRLLTDGLLPLILPYFARLRREGSDLAEPYLASVKYLTVLTWPFFATMMLLAYPIVRTLYGQQWDASVPIVELLCIAGAVSSISMFASHVMVANGQVRNSTYSQLIAQPFRIAAVLIASYFGLIFVAIAIILSEFITLIIVSWYLHKTINVGLFDVVRGCGKSALVTISTIIVPLAVNIFWQDSASRPWLPLMIGGFGAAIGWIAGMAVTRHSLSPHLMSALHSVRLRYFSR